MIYFQTTRLTHVDYYLSPSNWKPMKFFSYPSRRHPTSIQILQTLHIFRSCVDMDHITILNWMTPELDSGHRFVLAGGTALSPVTTSLRGYRRILNVRVQNSILLRLWSLVFLWTALLEEYMKCHFQIWCKWQRLKTVQKRKKLDLVE